MKCKICGSSCRSRACSIPCAIELTKRDKERKAAKEERKTHRVDKERLKTKREYVADAQKAFNAYIRERDRDLPCICCGEWPKISGKYGGDWDAGHYLSRGAHPELKFEEDNCHKQLKSCNAGSGKFSHKQKTVSQSYRERLTVKIGVERVEWLEGPHPPRKYTIPELMEIKAKYSQMARDLMKAAP